MQITRREGLKYGAGLAIATSVAPVWATSLKTPPSLQSLAAAKGMRFGTCVARNSHGGGFGNPKYAALIEAECGLLVPENELKWQASRPSASRFDFAAVDAILDYASSKSLAMRGHTLLWHRDKWMPRWVEEYDFGVKPAKEAEGLVTTHINTVLARYRDRIHGFDVVNESVMEDGSLAETALSKAYGGTEPLLDLAFHTARAAAPSAQLVYNDYMSWEVGNDAHRAGVLRLLEGFKKRGTPVDALGVQSHLIAQPTRPQERAWRDFIDAVVAMGYKLLITEFDIRDPGLPRDIAKRDAGVAALAKSYLEMMFSYPQLRDVLVWGLCDPFSWLQGFEPRADGAPTRGCLYDNDYRAKPIRDAVAAAFMSAPLR